MKKFLLFLAVVVSFASSEVVTALASNGSDPVELRDPKNGGRPRSPELNPITLSCLLYPDAEYVSLTASSSCYATVVIENTTTSDSSEEYVDLSRTALFELFGPGMYAITITLSNGRVFIGEFML